MTIPFSDLYAGAVQPLAVDVQDSACDHDLPMPPAFERSVHHWSQAEIDALRLAMASRRPLLVRGEPGTGKTQLARAAAEALGWHLHVVAIHPRTEAPDLVARFDAVRRLADAQAQRLDCGDDDPKYWIPGPLWWAFDWADAARFKGIEHARAPSGHVLLIDEIDKADSDLPNSLLELLGQRRLHIPALRRSIGNGHLTPLVIVTTNEERELPAAFVRRCMVLNLGVPQGMDYVDWLAQRGQAHHGAGTDKPLDDGVLRMAADQLVKDRAAVEAASLPPPGPAEYLDLLAALYELTKDKPPTDRADKQRELIQQLSAYAYLKHSGDAARNQPELAQTRTALGGAHGKA